MLSKTLLASNDRIKVIDELLKEFKNLEEDALSYDEMRKLEAEDKRMDRAILKRDGIENHSDWASDNKKKPYEEE